MMREHSPADTTLSVAPPSAGWEPTSDASKGLPFCEAGESEMLFRSSRSKTVHWSLPWSDLMMTMFIFFTVMYIYHSADREVLSSEREGTARRADLEMGAPADRVSAGAVDSAEPLRASISEIYDLSKETVKAADLEDFASVDLVADKAVRIILTADLLFDTGRADLRPEARKSLMRVAEIIRQTPYMVNVVGHTDNVSIHSNKFPTNWELSAVRACEVARFLIEEMQIPGNRFYVTGHAYYQPVHPNYTVENRAANRRVEIIITKERPDGMQARVENVSTPGSAW
jgi:chemotaxis protein MotB